MAYRKTERPWARESRNKFIDLGQLVFFIRMLRPFNGKKTISSTDGAETSGFALIKERSWDTISYHVQNTQNELKT